MADIHKYSRKLACMFVAVISAMFVACGGGGSANVNAPKGNAIGDRHDEFMRVVAHAKTMPEGMHPYTELPAELQLKNLVRVYVDKRRAYALEFPSHPIDSNPIFVFVEEGIPNPESVVREICSERGAWQYSRQLDEPGWYYVHGP